MIDLFILVADEVQLLGMGLAGVPDAILVEVVAKPPAKDNGVEFPLVHESFQKDGPLVDLNLHLDADFLEVVLHKGCNIAAHLVAVIRQQGKGEALPILHADAIGAGLPARLIQQSGCCCGIVGEGLHLGVVEPHLGGEDARGLLTSAIDDVFDHLRHINGLGHGLTDAQILEHRSAEIPPDVVVHIPRCAEEIESAIFFKTLYRPRIDGPEIDLTGLKGKLESQRVGQDTEDD